MTQAELPLRAGQAQSRFDGETYVHDRDGVRLNRQLQAVYNLMSDGAWRSLRDIATALGISEASASARLRDLRKPRFGSMTVERKHYDNGLFLYRVLSGSDN